MLARDLLIIGFSLILCVGVVWMVIKIHACFPICQTEDEINAALRRMRREADERISPATESGKELR